MMSIDQKPVITYGQDQPTSGKKFSRVHDVGNGNCLLFFSFCPWNSEENEWENDRLIMTVWYKYDEILSFSMALLLLLKHLNEMINWLKATDRMLSDEMT